MLGASPYRRHVPERQLIRVVSVGAEDAELARIRGRLGRDPLILAGPTPEAARVVQQLGAKPTVELLLAPVRFPPADRGHQLDTLVRRHAMADRYRDVVVVVDPASSTLLLRTLAPDQLASGGPVTTVALPRSARPISLTRVAAIGGGLGAASAVIEPFSPLPIIPTLGGVVGLVLLAVPARRRLGREVLLAAAIGIMLAFVLVASSARFPGSA